MLLSRYFLNLLIILLLNGCGFNSLYNASNHSNSYSQLATVQINQIPDRIGQQVRNELLNLLTPLGSPSMPRYTLHMSVKESKNSFAVQKNAFATRADIHLTANFVLRSLVPSKKLTSGAISTVSSYDIVSSDFATLAAEKNARERVVFQLSEEIRTRLAVYFVRQSKHSR